VRLKRADFSASKAYRKAAGALGAPGALVLMVGRFERGPIPKIPASEDRAPEACAPGSLAGNRSCPSSLVLLEIRLRSAVAQWPRLRPGSAQSVVRGRRLGGCGAGPGEPIVAGLLHVEVTRSRADMQDVKRPP
jgi:hypothetical protein